MVLSSTFLRNSLLGLFVSFSIFLSAQSDGDYRTNASGSWNWSTVANWEVYNTGAWGAATEYPGQSAGTGEVTIITDGAQITLDVSPVNVIGALTFTDGTVLATDITFGSNSLTVTGAITFGNPDADAGDQNIFVNSGTLTCGSVVMVNTDDNSQDTRIDIEDGTLTVNGDITTPNANRNNIRFVGVATGELYIDGDFNGNGFTCGAASTVYYNSVSEQIVGNTSYRNLHISGGTKTLRNSANVWGNLYLGTILDIENRQLRFGNSSTINAGTAYGLTEMITISDGGVIRQDCNDSGDLSKTYPMGLGSEYTPFTINSISTASYSGYIIYRWYDSKNTFTVGTDNALTRYWNISSSLSITDADLSFVYNTDDASSPITETDLVRLGHFDGNNWNTWIDSDAEATIDHSNNQFSFSGSTSLVGDWTLGEDTGCFDGTSYTGTVSITNGYWNSGSTWNTGTPPVSGEEVTVAHAVTCNVDANIQSLTILTGASLNVNNINLSVSNNADVSGALRDSNGSGSFSIGGNVIIDDGGNFNIERSALNVTGDVTVLSGGILRDTHQTGSATFNSNLSVEAGGSFDLDESIVNVTGSVSVAGTMYDSDNEATGVTNVGGDLTVESGGSFNLQNGVVNITGITDVYGTLSDTDADGTNTFGGKLTVYSGGDFNSNQTGHVFPSEIENNGSFTISSAYNFTNDITFSGASSIQFTNTANFEIDNNITLTNQNTGGLEIAGNVIVNAGSTLDLKDNSILKLGDAYSLTNNGILKVVGTSGNPATVTTSGIGGYTISQTSVGAEFHSLYGVFDYTGGITITDGTIDGTNNFGYTTFSNGSGSSYLNITGLDPIGGLSSVQSAVFESGPTNNVIRTSGTATVEFLQATGALSGENFDSDNANPGTLINWTDPSAIYYSTGDVSAYATASWAHNEDGTGGNPSLADLTAGTLTLIVQDGHTVTLDSNGDIDVRKLIVGEGTSGSFLIGGDATQQTLTVQELIEVKAGGTLIPNSEGAPAHIIKLYGNLINNGTINLRQSFTTVANMEIYGNMELSGANTPVFSELSFESGCNATAGLAIDVNWNLILESGATFNDGGFTHTVEYNWENNGGTYNATGGLEFDGGTASIVSTGTSTTFNDVTFNSAGLNTIKEATVVNGDFVVGNNTQVSVDNITVTVNGNFNIGTGSKYVQAQNYTRFNSTAAQTITLDGTTSFDDISFSNGGSNAKSIAGNIIANGIVIINVGATVDGAGSHEIAGGLRVDGTCNFSGTIILKGGYLEANDASVSAFTLGTAELIIDGSVSLRHRNGGSNVAITIQNNVTIIGGYLVINDSAILIGQPAYALTLEAGRNLYIRGADNFPNGFGTYDFNETANVVYDASIDQTIRGGFSYGRLYVRNANTKTVDGPLIITGRLYLRDGATLDLQNYSHTFSGATIYNGVSHNGSIDGSNATMTIGGVDFNQTLETTGTGTYTFNNLILSQSGATATRTITFNNGCDVVVTNDLTIQNVGGTEAIQYIVDLNTNGISGPASNLSLGAYCKLYTDQATFGSAVIDNFSGSKTIDATSTIRYNLNGVQAIADGITYGNIELNGGDKTAEGTLDIDGNISRIGNTPVFYDGGFSHTLAGDWLLTSTDYYTQASATGTIIFDGVDQDINGYIFNNMTIANSGTASLFRSLTIYGDLTVNDASSFDASTLSMNIGGDITVNGTGVYSQTTGTTTLDGMVNQDITLSVGSTIGNLTINKTNPAAETATLLSDMHISNDLIVNKDAGILDISNQNLYIGDDFTIYDYTGVTNFITTGSTITFNGSNAQQITTYHEDNLVFNNLVFEGSGDKTFDYNDPAPDIAAQNFEIDGDFTINGSVIEGNNVSLYVRGDWNNNGTFNHWRTVYFDGADQNISSSGFYHVNFQGSGTKTLGGNISVAYDLYIDGTANLNANGNDITLGDDWYNNVVGASYTHGNGKLILNGANYAEFYTGTTAGSQAGKVFYDVVVNKTSNGVYLYGDLVVENDLTINSRELRTNAYDVYVAGNFDNNSTYYCNNNSSLLTLNASGGSKVFNPGGATIRGLTINAPGTTYEMQSDFTLDNVDMSIVAGTLDLNKNQMTLNDAGRKIDIDGGTLYVDSASIIQFTNTQNINLNSGELYLVGKDGMTADLKNSHATNDFFVNAIGGTLHAKYYSVQKGSIIVTGSTVDGTNNFSDGTFTEGDAGTSYIDLTGIDLGSGITLTNMTFNDGADYNVTRTSGTGTVTLQDASGAKSGELYEQDNGSPGTLIDWTFPSGFFWDGQGSAANTDWNEPLNWDGNTVPGINNIVYLDHSVLSDAYNVDISGTDGACSRLNIDIQGGNSISVNVGSNTKLDVLEHVNIGTGTTLSQTDNTALIYVGKNWTNQGTYTHGNSKVIFNGTSGSYIINSGGVGVGKTFYDLEIDAATTTYALDAAIEIENDLTITNGTFDLSSPNNDVDLGGDWYLDQASGGLFVPSTADVTMSGTTQSITNGTFYNLNIGATSTTTLNSNIAIDNTIVINSGSTLNAQENNIYIRNDWQNDGGTFSQSGLGTVIFDGTNTQMVDQGTSSTTFNHLTFSNTGAKTFANNVSVNGDVQISTGTGLVNLKTYTLTGVGADNTLTNNRYLQIEGASNFPTGFETLNFTNTSETRYWADINQDVYAATYGTISFRSLTDGITSTKTALGDLVVTNDIYFTSANRHAILDLAINDVNITLTDNIDMRGSSSMTWGTGNSTLEHVGGFWRIDADITGFNNLILGGTSDKYTQGNLTIDGDLTVKSGVDLFMYEYGTRNNFRTITGTASGIISMETGARMFNTRPATDGPAIPESFGTYDFNESSTYYLYSAGINQTVYTGSSIVYGNLTFDTTKDVTSDGIANLNVDGNWDIEDATYYDGGMDMEIGGANIYLTSYVPSSTDRVLILDGLRDQTVRDDIDNSISLASITLAGSGVKTLCDGNDVITINGNLTINSDVTLTSGENVTFNGTSWVNNGIYTQTGGILTFSGASDQTIDAGAEDVANYFRSLVFAGTSTKTFVNNGADINNDFTINEGTVDLGSQDYYILDEIDNTSGGILLSSNANLTLDGGDQSVNTPNFAINNITISGTGTKYLYSNWDVNGSVTIDSGARLNVRSNSTDYDINVGRHWTNNGIFYDQEGKVTFDGSISPVNITGGGYNLYNVDFAPTANVTYNLLSPTTRFANVMNIGTNATLDINGQALYLGRDNTTSTVTHTIDGTLNIDEGSFLYVNNDNLQTTLDVNGALNILGSNSSNIATLTSETTGNVNKTQININSGATMAARYYLIEYISDEGINMASGSTLDATNNFSDGTFLNMRDIQDARYLVLECDYAGGNISNVSFNYSGTPVEGRHYNVERKLAASNITFDNVTGSLGTYKFEDDDQAVAYDNGLCRWPEITETYWTGAVDIDWHKAGNWDNGVPTSTMSAVIPDKSIDPVIFSGDAICKSLTITDGVLRLESDNNITVVEDVSISDGLLFVNSSGSNIYVGGDWAIGTSGNYNHGNSTITFNSGNGIALITPGTSSFNNVVFDNASTIFQLSGSTVDIDGDLTITNGTLAPSTNNQEINLYGDYTITNGDFDATGATNGTILLKASGDQIITDAEFDNVVVDGSGNKSFAGTVVINGTTDVNSALVAQTGSAIEFKGNVTVDAAGSFNDGDESHTFNGANWYGIGTYTGAGTITFNRTAGYQYLYASSFNNLTVDCAGQRLYLEGDVNVTGDVTFKNGIGNVYLQTSTITSDGSGTFTVEDAVNVYVYGVNNFPKTFATYALSSTSNTRYYGSSNQNIDGVSYGNLFLQYPNTKTLAGNTEVKGGLYFYQATLDVSASNYSLTVGGIWDNNDVTGGHFICRSGEVIFTNTANQGIYVGGANTNDFYNLTVSGSARVSASNNTSNDFIVQNNLNVTSGEFNANWRTIYVGADLVASGTGTFYANNGTYYLNKASGSANIAGNGSSLLNITINSGATYTAQGDVDVNGNFTLSSGTFDGNGNTITLGNGSGDVITIDGTYKVGAGGVLGIGNSSSLTVGSGGRIEVVGNGTGLAKVTNNDSGGRYGFTVEGEIAAEYYMFEYMSNVGVYLTGNSTIDATNHFSNGTFSNGATTGQLFRIENTQSFSGVSRIENVSFPNNPGGSSSNVAKYTAASGSLEFYNSTGVFAGEQYDNDPSDLIDWTGPVSLTWNGSVSSDWNTANNWTPSYGLPIVPTAANNVVIASAVNQPVLTIAGQQTGNLTIESGAEIRINTSVGDNQVDLDVDGDLIIDGTIRTISTQDSITVEGNWTAGSGATVLLNGDVTFDGVGGAKLVDNRSADFYSLTISGSTQYQISRNTNVINDVIIESGAYLDANPADYSITLGGNWTNNGTFGAQQGTVVFSAASGSKNIYAGSSSFYNVNINASGVTYNLTNNMNVGEDLNILAGTVDVQTNTLQIGDGTGTEEIGISGTLLINAGATLDMGNGSKLNVNSGGSIELLGTDDANRAHLTSSTMGRYSFDVNSGASIKASYYTVDYTDADGLHMHPGANIDATYNLSDGIFSNGYPSSGSYMTLLHEMGAEETLKNLVFNAGPAYCVSRVSGTTIFHFEDATGVLGNFAYEKDDEVTPSPSSGLLRWPFVNLYTWEGDVDNNWLTPGNWYDDQLPITTSDVTIPSTASDPVIDNSQLYEFHGLTIEAGATLTIQEGARVTINGDIITNDGLIIQNSDTNPASVITNGTITGDADIEWSLPEMRYWYIGHSVTGVTLSQYDASLKQGSNDYLLYNYNNAWVKLNGSGHTFPDPLEGYSLMIKEAGSTLTYSGVINGDASYSMSNMAAQWHLIANPYPAYFDVTDGVNLGSFLKTTWTRTNVGVSERGFATYNLVSELGQNGGTKYVTPGQSIWLRTYTNNDAITIPASARLHTTGELKSSSGESGVIRLNLKSDYTSDELVLAFRENGADFITGLDSEKKKAGGKVANFYSMKEEKEMAINVMPALVGGESIDLGYSVASKGISTFVINVQGVSQIAPEFSVFLKDNVSGLMIDLRQESSYEFNPEVNTTNNRFELVFEKIATSIDDETMVEELDSMVKIYAVNEKAYVDVTTELLQKSNGDAVVEVYSISGQLIDQVHISSTQTVLELPKAHEIYIVKVSAGDRSYQEKIETF